jgi:hypothetical protein
VIEAKHDLSGSSRADVDPLRLTEQVARRAREVLPLPLIHVGPNHVAIGAVKFGKNIENSLDGVVAGREVAQRFYGGTGSRGLDRNALTCRHPADVETEKTSAGTEARLDRGIWRHKEKNPAGANTTLQAPGKQHGDLER